MRPGLIIQHGSLPVRGGGLVRCDIGALIGFVTHERWPAEATAGDFLLLKLRRWEELAEHSQRDIVDPRVRRAVRAFFENGGDELYVYAVCVRSEDELVGSGLGESVLGPLLESLRGEEDISLIGVPSLAYMRCDVSRKGEVRWHGESLVEEFLAHCRQMNNRFMVIDAPRGLHGDLLTRWFEGFRRRDPITRAFGAVYYPWLMRGDEAFPAAGAIMGLFARVELEHRPIGVGWPPANVPVLGATHTEVEMDWSEAGSVGDAGINPLIVQPGRGVVVWGARTMSTDPKWVHINSRRIVSMITEQLRRDNEWAVFEPNDPGLWKVIERDVLVRLEQFWAAGILSGARAQGEYSVECSRATNPPDVRDRGELHVSVQVTPVGTTERILVDLRLGSTGP